MAKKADAEATVQAAANERARRLALLRGETEGATEEERRTLAAVIIQSYCRGWQARRELSRLRQEAERAAAAKEAAEALTRGRADVRRALRAAARDCLLAFQAQQDYNVTRKRLVGKVRARGGQGAAGGSGRRLLVCSKRAGLCCCEQDDLVHSPVAR